MADVSFGEWLKRRRHAAGLTQEQLARQIHCSVSALRKFEAEVRHPSTEVIERLADIFNIPLEERKSFSRFARGDWRAMSERVPEDSPWRISTAHSSPRSNLPIATSSFIGREKGQEEIIRLINKSRLVTLTGAGGIGKSRLSIQSASALLEKFPDGVWLVEFAPLSDPALVPQAIVNTLGLIEQANKTPLSILTDFLKHKKALLILDNCEHIIQACAQLTEALLQSCSNLYILATSREAMSIAGETIYLVPSLTTPDLQQSALETLSQYEAVQLFVDRTQSTTHDFVLTPDNSSYIGQICRHLDGIPLAIELAAARVKVLRVDEIAARLDDRFHLLTNGARTALPRHQTLQAMIDWSHDLLSELEQIMLRRLSIFAGSWTLEGAVSVCAGDGIKASDILNLLTNLLNKSLILVEHKQGQETRYRMLETIRQYAGEKLSAAGEEKLIRQCHLAYYVDLAERAEPNLRAFDMVMWLDRLESELDNIRIALDYALKSDIEAELRLASAVKWFWHIRGYRSQGVIWLERGLNVEKTARQNQPLTNGRALIRGKALNASGILQLMFFDLGKAQTRLEESLTLFQKMDRAGKKGLADSLYGLASLPSMEKQARSLLEQSLSLFREVDDKFGIAECLMQLRETTKDLEQTIKFSEEHLALRREIGDQDGIAIALALLGGIALDQGNFQQAILLSEESITLFRKVGNKWATVGFAVSNLVAMYLRQGDYERANEICENALALAQDIGDSFMTAFYLYNLGVIAWLHFNSTQAIQIITESIAVFREVSHHWMEVGCLHALGDIHLAQGDEKKAIQAYEAELSLAHDAQIKEGIIFGLYGSGKVACMLFDYDQAKIRFQEVLLLSREENLKLATFHAICGLGRVAYLRGDYADANALYKEALEIHQQQIGDPFYWVSLKSYGAAVAYPLGALAALANLDNQTERAVKLIGASEHTYNLIQFQLTPFERSEYKQSITTARATLGDEEFAALYEEGKKMSLDEAIAYALKAD